jgi:hypothetical protein
MTSLRRWPHPIDHVYILCDPVKEPDRAKYLFDWLGAQRIDPACYTVELKYYGDTLTVDHALSVYNPWVDRKPVEQERNYNSYHMKMSEISLVLNWAHAARKAVDACHRVIMMFESDVIFSDDFLEKLEAVLRLIPASEFDFLSLSPGPGLRPPRAADDTGFKWFGAPPYYHTRTCDAMVFRVDMLRRILGTLIPFAEVLDWEMNYQLTLHKSRSFWLDPPIVQQGSQGSGGGVYESLL